MNLKIWSPRYAKNRIQIGIRKFFHKDQPWLTSGAINFLKGYLRHNDFGLEWGSGRSTIWFAKRVNRLISIETNPTWYNKVQATLQDDNLQNATLRFVAAEPYSEYLKECADIPEDSLDFVLIDGIHRHLAATVSIPLLKEGGLLIIDNINWYIPSPFGYAPESVKRIKPEWSPVAERLKGWRCFWTTDGVTDTAIWFKTCICGTKA